MNKEVKPMEEDYMGDHVFYWFYHKSELFEWVNKITNEDQDNECRFGGNFIDVEPEAFKKFIDWVWDDCTRVAIAGYTGSKHDLVVDEIYLEPKPHVLPKLLRRKCHICKAEEVHMENGLVRAWWD